MQTTLQPAFTAGTICGSISSRLLCVLMHTTSGFLASTAAKSVVIFTSQGRPRSSPTVFPSLAGLVTMQPTRSMSFGRSRMYPRRPWPIMPVPHSATLIISRPPRFSCTGEYRICSAARTLPRLVGGVRLSRVGPGASGARPGTWEETDARPAAKTGPRAGRVALRRAAPRVRSGVLEEAGRPCRGRGWRAPWPSSPPGRSVPPAGAGGRHGCYVGAVRGSSAAATTAGPRQPPPAPLSGRRTASRWRRRRRGRWHRRKAPDRAPASPAQ